MDDEQFNLPNNEQWPRPSRDITAQVNPKILSGGFDIFRSTDQCTARQLLNVAISTYRSHKYGAFGTFRRTNY